MDLEQWEEWNARGGPKYPHEKVVQFCFRNYPDAESRRGLRALDLGCGSGVHTVFLAREGFQVVAIDAVPAGIENTLGKLASLDLKAEVYRQRAEALCLPKASIDLILCIGLLECLGPQAGAACVARAAGVARKGARGLFLFTGEGDFRLDGKNEYHLHGFTRDEVDRMFEDRFEKVWIDRYVTTYEGGRIEQRDWLVTVQR